MNKPNKDDLLALSKADLQAEYKDTLKEEAPANMNKADLADAILTAAKKETATEKQVEKPAEKTAVKIPKKTISKKDTDSNVLHLTRSADSEYSNGEEMETTMVKRTYDLLPPHKYGWQIAAPAETE